MSSETYPHTYYYGPVSSYNIPSDNYSEQYNSDYFATSDSLNNLPQAFLHTEQNFPLEIHEHVYPVCPSYSTGQIGLPTNAPSTAFRFNDNNISYYYPRQMNTSNPPLNTTTYPQSNILSYSTQYLPSRMIPGPNYSPTSWPQPQTPTETPWLEPSAMSYSDDGHDDEEVDNEDNHDKPYAKLIHQCLMEAHGHRMLLRDIYEWFEKYTKKPQESGSKGWQNSIRHNLSMNKAFENDKNDPAAKGGARKANSVWVLTEHAIKNGVESTTRYRKSATSRRGSNKRTPAVQRQRSGARGGRATRRGARVKLSQENPPQASAEASIPDGSTITGYEWSPLSSGHDLYSPYGYSPITPSGDQMLNPGYSLPRPSYYDYGQQMLPKLEEESQFLMDEDQDPLVRQILYQSSTEEFLQEAT